MRVKCELSGSISWGLVGWGHLNPSHRGGVDAPIHCKLLVFGT